MNFVWAIIIGAIIGVVGWYLVKDRQPNAVWLSPVLGIVGAVVASIIAAIVGKPGYGIKEALLQVVLAVIAVGVLVVMAMRRTGASAAAGGTRA